MKEIKNFITHFRIAFGRGKGFKKSWSDAMYLTKLLNSKVKKENPYDYMGRIGISPEYMKMYTESVNKIKEYEQEEK